MIAGYRLMSQQVAVTRFSKPGELVRWMGALQAQDYAMAKWAIALRLDDCTDERLEMEINNAGIIRTHILRPTWHFVNADDIRWMLRLTAPHLQRAMASTNKKLELDKRTLLKTQKILTRQLEGGRQLTREELMSAVNRSGIKTDPLRAIHIMYQAELEGIVCNGIKKGKQFTYALLDERVPAESKQYTREEMLAMLAKRYFQSHAPATVQDFAWWSGLGMTEARQAVELIRRAVVSEIIDGTTYWMMPDVLATKPRRSMVHLLPAFDEFMISYKDRTASLVPEHNNKAITGNGIFKPIIVVDGKVAGTWKTIAKKDKLAIETEIFDATLEPDNRKMRDMLERYARFRQATVTC